MAWSRAAVVGLLALALVFAAWLAWREDPRLTSAPAGDDPVAARSVVVAATGEEVRDGTLPVLRESVPTNDEPPAGAEVRGRCVADEDGRPLAGCAVRFDEASEPLAVTDHDGEFVVTVPGEQPFDLFVTAAGKAPRRGVWTQPLGVGQRENLGDVRLRNGFVVTGRVVEEGGAGVAGQGVVVFGVDRALRPGEIGSDIASAETDAFGAFELDLVLPAGSWRAQVLGRTQQGSGDFVVDARSGVEPLTLVVAANTVAILGGVVVDDVGEPVADVLLESRQPSGSSFTGPDGRFRIDAQAVHGAPTELVVRLPGRCDVDERARTVRWGDEEVRIELRRGVDLAVVVTDDAGEPVEEFGVWLARDAEPVLDEGRSRFHGRHEGGRVVIAPARRGANLLRVFPHGERHMASEPQRIVVEDGPQRTVRVALERLHPCEVVVVGPDGEPVRGARLELLRARNGVDTGAETLDLRQGRIWWAARSPRPELVCGTETDAQGQAEVLAPRDVADLVLRIDCPPFVRHHEVAPGLRPGAMLRIELGAAGAIHGTVDLHGTPPGEFGVVVEDPNGVRVAADGRGLRLGPGADFELQRLQPGRYRVVVARQFVWRQGGSSQVFLVPLPETARDLDVRAGAPTRVALDAGDLALGELHGTLRGTGGVSGWSVDLVRVEGDAMRHGAFAVGADGSFRAEGLLPGRYRLQIRPDPSNDGDVAQLADLVEIRAGAVTHHEFVFERRRLVLRLRHPDGRPVTEQWQVRCGTQIGWRRRGSDCVLDPAPEVPVQVRLDGADEWSAPVEMPADRSEWTTECVVPPRR